MHRDLKPSNIMVVECGDRLTPKLLDLGIARGSWRRRSELAPDDDGDDDPGERREVNPDAAADGVDGDRDHDTDRDGDTDPFGAGTDRLPVRPRLARRRGRYHDSETRRRLTPPDATLGSRAYMVPEQFGGADGAGPEADVYALGVVAYRREITLRVRRAWTAGDHCKPRPLGNGIAFTKCYEDLTREVARLDAERAAIHDQPDRLALALADHRVDGEG